MRGLTLVELMIVVAILAIISAVAIPGYQDQVRDARRSDATAVLMQARQAMERQYSKFYSYDAAVAGTTFPSQSPADGVLAYYTISVVKNATSFTLTATAVGAQDYDDCGNLSINQAGQKGAKDSAPGATAVADVQECW